MLKKAAIIFQRFTGISFFKTSFVDIFIIYIYFAMRYNRLPEAVGGSVLNLEKNGPQFDQFGFSKNVFSRDRVRAWFFVTSIFS